MVALPLVFNTVPKTKIRVLIKMAIHTNRQQPKWVTLASTKYSVLVSFSILCPEVTLQKSPPSGSLLQLLSTLFRKPDNQEEDIHHVVVLSINYSVQPRHFHLSAFPTILLCNLCNSAIQTNSSLKSVQIGTVFAKVPHSERCSENRNERRPCHF